MRSVGSPPAEDVTEVCQVWEIAVATAQTEGNEWRERGLCAVSVGRLGVAGRTGKYNRNGRSNPCRRSACWHH